MKKWKCVACQSTCTVRKFDWWWDWNYANPSRYKWTAVSGWWIFKKWKCPQHNQMSYWNLSQAAVRYLRYKTLQFATKPLKMVSGYTSHESVAGG